MSRRTAPWGEPRSAQHRGLPMTPDSTPIMQAPAAASRQRAWRALVNAASTPYRRAGRYALHFARGKLRGDPVFRHVLEHGLIAPRSRVLDLGCGQGLLASLLGAAGAAARAGRWPAGWAAAPTGVRVTGIELMARDVERARAALGDAATFVHGDMCETAFPPVDVVVAFDSLHYIGPREQDEVLARVGAALPEGGALLLRVGDAGSRSRYALGLWIDRITLWLRGGGFAPLAGRTVTQWTAALVALGFKVDAQPMNGRPPFVNQLLVARRGAGDRR